MEARKWLIASRPLAANARWQSVAKMEEEFKHVANEIRKARGLGPQMQELVA